MRKPNRKQAGDTIVEVLIAMSIVSLVLAGAYVSTNRNTASTRDAQEHAEALKLVETQIEYLRADAHGDRTYQFDSASQCFNSSGAPAKAADCTLQANGDEVSDDQPFGYILKIDPRADVEQPFKISATWESSTGTPSNVTLYYRPS